MKTNNIDLAGHRGWCLLVKPYETATLLDVHDLGSLEATPAGCQQPLQDGPPDAVATNQGKNVRRPERCRRWPEARPAQGKTVRVGKVVGSNPGAGNIFHLEISVKDYLQIILL